MNIQQWLQNHDQDLQGKVAVVTGAAGGLGSLLCRHLARLHARVIMLDRNVDYSETVKAKILAEYPNAQLETMKVDLNNMVQVQRIVQTLQDQPIDFLILCAGVYNVPLQTSELGYNNVFQINFIAPYYLVKTLMPTLARTNGKVVAVGSIAHTYGKLDEHDLDYTKHRKASQVYGNSKRFLMFALSELFQNQTDVRLAIVHPGVTLTPMTNHYHPAINWLVKLTMKIAFPKPEQAVLSLLAGVLQDCDRQSWIGPKRAGIWGEPTVLPLTSGTPEERAKIFSLAEDIYYSAELFLAKSV